MPTEHRAAPTPAPHGRGEAHHLGTEPAHTNAESSAVGLAGENRNGGSPVRKVRIAIGSVLLIVLLLILFVPQLFDLKLSRETLEATWLLFLLSALSFFGVVVLSFVLFRQLLKLYAERRANILGSKFKTKLVIGALGLSLVPVFCMFIFSRGLINRTLEKWFSRPVEAVRDDTREIAGLLADYIRANAGSEVRSIVSDPDVQRAVRDANWPRLGSVFAGRHDTIQGGFALATTADGRIVSSLQLPEEDLDPGVLSAPRDADHIVVRGTQYMLAREQVGGSDPPIVIEIGMPVPSKLTAKMAALQADSRSYQRLSAERRSLGRVYTSYLLLLTLVILFAATWFALFLSKMVTVPMQALVAATEEISRGNLAHRIRVRAKDEIRNLVSSFNHMAAELETGRAQIEASRQELRIANAELQRRRQYTETLLESIPSAVISIQNDCTINRVNPAVLGLFGKRASNARSLSDLLDSESFANVERLLRKCERLGAVAAQIEISPEKGRSLTAAVTAAPIPSTTAGEYAGYVVVLEDLTDVLRIQKMAAWREVAQRIAHEIRNPLTPIALSAQRAQRRVEKLATGERADAESLRVIAQCSELIQGEVRTLQHLVDEFSAFARFPAPQPAPCDLNEIAERALRAFEGRLEGVHIQTRFGVLPAMALDAEGMKRVLVNLIDNAADAVRQSPYREISITTSASDGMVELVVADTGEGIKPADKERLFLPYFSTKRRGTGLGLAVATRIVEEHGGSIRAEENQPVGTRFILELPVIRSREPLPAITVASV